MAEVAPPFSPPWRQTGKYKIECYSIGDKLEQAFKLKMNFLPPSSIL